MEEKNSAVFRRIIALLLCAAMLMPFVPTPVRATGENAAETQTVVIDSMEAQTLDSAATDEVSCKLQNINWYQSGEVIMLFRFWATEIAFGSCQDPATKETVTFNADASASWSAFINGEYKKYTAFIVESLGAGESGGYEWFVDAIVDGNVVSNEPITQIKAHTDNGFVVLIPTVQLTAENTPSRGDLVHASSWITQTSPADQDTRLGKTGLGDKLTFFGNPTQSVARVEAADVATDLNATVKLFNYDENINTAGTGFSFWAGFWGYGGDVETVDGEGVEGDNTDSLHTNRYPDMAEGLGSDGYPVLANGTSLSYLFDGSSLRLDGTSTQVAQMAAGGGLFQKDEDGYYYYDSLQNAAHYDASANKFVLSKDLVVRPWYGTGDGTDYEEDSTGTWVPIAPGGKVENYGNFLPFNEVNADTITMDGSVDYEIPAIDSADRVYPNPDYVQGSLEYYGLNANAAKKVLTGTKGVTTDVTSEIDKLSQNITTARLEQNPDMWFGMTVDVDFYMPEGGQVNGQDMIFDFHGDDDVFVYVGVWNGTDYDYKLVLDIGGVHAAKSGTINFATGVVTDTPATYNGIHNDEDNYVGRSRNLKDIFGLDDTTFADYTKLKLKFFYLERGGNISYCRLRFNIPTLPHQSLTVTKELSTQVAANARSFVKESESFTFRVVQKDNTAASYFNAGTPYSVLENGIQVDSGVLAANGLFTLKAGQSAQFADVLENSVSGGDYIVQELIPTDVVGQYDAVYYSIGGAVNVQANGAAVSGDTIFSTGELAAEQTQTVVFRNDVNTEKTGRLEITKVLTEKAAETLADQTFRMQVTVEGEPLPVGTAYTVDGTPMTVEEAGVILLKNGEMAVIKGILAGSSYVVKERNVTGGFAPTFTGTVVGESAAKINFASDSAYGEMPVSGVAQVTVTNDLADTDLVLDKTVEETGDPDKFVLTLEAYATGETTNVVSTKPADIVLVVDQSASMYTPAGMTVDRLWADKDLNTAPIPESAKVDLVKEIADGNTTVLENAKHTGYYIAVANGYTENGVVMEDEYLYIVQYAQYKDGNETKWGWFYVPVDVTTRPVTVDTANTTESSTEALFTAEPQYDSNRNPIYYKENDKQVDELRVNDFGTCTWDYALMSSMTYYKSQYGELYDAVKTFVKELNETGVDHKLAIVGFSSPFYDAMDYYCGTGLYVNGQYYLYDTDYLYKGSYDSSNNLVVDPNGEVILDPDEGHKGAVFTAVAADPSEYAFLPIFDQETNVNWYPAALTSVKDNLTSINASVEAIHTNYMQTCPAVGIRIARNIFRGTNIPISDSGTTALDTTERDKIIILFSDGVPTVSMDCDYENAVSKNVEEKYEHFDGRAGAASAINEANLAKKEGITIYTIGTGATENVEFADSNKEGDWAKPLMEVISSNYPNAVASFDVVPVEGNNQAAKESTYSVTAGNVVEGANYATLTSSGTSVEIAFDNVFSSVTNPSVNLNETAVLKEVLSDYFELDSNSTVDIKVYTQAYDPTTGSWKQKEVLEGATVTLSCSDGSTLQDETTTRYDTVEVKGFDYHDEYVSNVAVEDRVDADGNAYYGSKLVVEVTIERRAGFWGGNNVPTNESTTGIYSEGTVVERFPIPEANVPLDVQIVAKDKTIYYGGDVTAKELIQSVTADGVEVTVKDDGTFEAKEPWMSMYADLNWTDGSTKPDSVMNNLTAADYVYEIRMTPKATQNGKDNMSGDPGNIAGTPVSAMGLTDSDTGHVYILVPQVIFKDSTAELNTSAEGYDYKGKDYISTQWIHMESNVPEDAPAVSGTAPTLTLTFNPERGTFTEDTRVDVTIKSSDPDGDIASVTTYKWDNCIESLHSQADHGTIESHKANEEGKHEFWIHVDSGDEVPSDMVLDKTVAGTADPNKFELTLDAYSLASIEDIAKPSDIVLVLDHSGSMHTPIGATSVLDSDTIYTGPGQIPDQNSLDLEKGQQFGYYIAQSQDESSKSWFVLQYHEDTGSWKAYLVRSTEAIVNTQYYGTNRDGVTADGVYLTEHEMTLEWKHGNLPTTLVFYKTQYAMLYDEVNSFVNGLKTSGMDHRVSIVAFAGSTGYGSGVYVYSGADYFKAYATALYHENTTQERRNELYQLAMKSVQDDAEFAELNAAINAINTNYSFTCPAVGIKLANEILEANPVDADSRDRIVVLFTDGIPNVKIGEAVGNDATTRTEIYNEIVTQASETKTKYGANVYCISTTTLGESENDRTFLSYTSSDYPNAVSYENHGESIEPAKYTFHGSTDALEKAFDAIQGESIQNATDWSDGLTMKEVLSDYFVLDDSARVTYEVYTQEYEGKDTDGAEKWAEPVLVIGKDSEGNVVTSDTITATLSSSGDDSGREDVIEISGFNYYKEYVSDTPRKVKDEAGNVIDENYYGKKLILKVYIETRDGFWGGNDVPTNENTTAIYSGSTVVDVFPEPKVNVPIVVEVVANDETIYYGNGYTGSDLFESVTINENPVNYDEEKRTFTPAEGYDWADDFVEKVEWSKNSSLPSDTTPTEANPDGKLSNTEPKDYTFGVTVTPTTSGNQTTVGTPNSSDGVTGEDTGHVYILVPTLTFQDSHIDFTTTPGIDYYPENNVVKNEDGTVKVEWNFMEDTADSSVAPGLDERDVEPELTLTFDPQDETTGFTVDTPVDVTVSSSNRADYSGVTDFDWIECDHELHDEKENIEKHKAYADNPEFYIHVNLKIDPDTVVIDYGLPVDIDVLSNDPAPDGTTITRVFDGIRTVDATEFVKTPVNGKFGVLSINSDNTVRYLLNDADAVAEAEKNGQSITNGIQMNEEEVFAYGVTYTKNGVECSAQSTVTVIPATIIYYEDSFLTYKVFDNETGEVVDDPSVQWELVKDENYTENAEQTEHTPGMLESLDPNSVYGYDGSYTSMSKYSLGSAKMVNVGDHVITDENGDEKTVNTCAKAYFTFWGTGFDVISLTSAKTGTIVVQVVGVEAGGIDAEGKAITKSYMVDTYYGYKWARYDSNDDGTVDENDEYGWVVDTDNESTDGNDLYQIPVMKVEDLPYGKYNVTITASHAGLFDHEQYDGTSYDFYLDAIRIYDPANDGENLDGTVNDTIQGAYTDDGEGWPEYFELRDLLISKEDFDSRDGNATVNGIIFIDNSTAADSETSYSIEDYANYGPNNELYLAPGQSVAFALTIPGDVANIHLAMKSVNGTVNVSVYDADDESKTSVTPTTLQTATDLYYDITSLNNHTVVITNTGDANILSITNIKVTYNSEHEDDIEDTFFTVNDEVAGTALASLAAVPEDEEPEVPETTVPEEPTETTVPEEPTETTVPEEPTETTVPEEPTETTVPEEPTESTDPEEEEPAEFEPAKFQVRLSKNSVKVGSTVTVTVTTSTDVDHITVNGVAVTDYTGSRWSRTRTWRVRVTAEEVGEMDVNVVCYNTDGKSSETVTETVTVTEQYSNIGDWLIGIIGGWFGRRN